MTRILNIDVVASTTVFQIKSIQSFTQIVTQIPQNNSNSCNLMIQYSSSKDNKDANHRKSILETVLDSVPDYSLPVHQNNKKKSCLVS